ncbi:MAG TPA: glycine cleavage system aminomethyltransferase GcvT [Bacteroidota bacterium]|nr:glycine cleavage system aminomethyltransferase GcvT [Bacteroidota bacterium]
MKRTAFYPIHKQLNAKVVEFSGYEMPLQYSGIFEEHRSVRNNVGLFDVSHMGEFEIRGTDALTFVQYITTNDASKLSDGKAQYSLMCDPNGGIVDDLLVYKDKDHFMFVVNAANISKDFEWINNNRENFDVEMVDKSDEISLLALQGPKSLGTLQKLTKFDLSTIPYYSFVHTNVVGLDITVSRTGYTGELGFELYFDSTPATAERMWNTVMDAGKEFNIKPIGLGARDTLRLEMGYCLYGSDIDTTTNPLEAGLIWITKLEKDDFIGKTALLRIKQQGIKKKLIGFMIEKEKAMPRHGYEICTNGSPAGFVTSGMISPMLDKGIGLGYVPSQYARPGSSVTILIRGREISAKIVDTPFIKK